MSKQKKRKYKELDEDDIIIGYNSKGMKDKPPKRKNKRKAKNRWRKIKRALILILKIILILAIIIGIGIFLFISPVFNITDIRIENANKISENTYINLSDIQIGENIFKINKSNISEQIKTESYVEDVEIKRELPGTVVIEVKERTPKYMIEKNGGLNIYVDKNGYALEENMEAISVPVLKGIETDINNLNMGDRLIQEDLNKFNDVIKIMDGLKSKNIDTKLSSIDISDDDNYILEFNSERKTVMLGDLSTLSTKMMWIEYFIENEKNSAGTVHLNTEDVYFSPAE